jgi:hypothetical protein
VRKAVFLFALALIAGCAAQPLPFISNDSITVSELPRCSACTDWEPFTVTDNRGKCVHGNPVDGGGKHACCVMCEAPHGEYQVVDSVLCENDR